MILRCLLALIKSSSYVQLLKLSIILLFLFAIFYCKNLFDIIKIAKLKNCILNDARSAANKTRNVSDDLMKCSKKFNETVLRNLKNKFQISLNKQDNYTYDQIERMLVSKNFSLKLGGKWWPKLAKCEPDFNVAIVVPYRNRESNLKLFLLNMHAFFMQQLLSYQVYLIEPLANLTFNRGLLMNIGFSELIKDDSKKFDCFFMHDVDMIAEDRRNIYKCDKSYPVHYAVNVSKFGYATTGYFGYNGYYGGINAFTREQYEKINGFSNNYWNWGAEDDDLRIRTLKHYFKYERRPPDINRYFMPDHEFQTRNENRNTILETSNSKYAALNRIDEGIGTLKYVVKKIEQTMLFTRYYVSYPIPRTK